jgi:hypothetical protein
MAYCETPDFMYPMLADIYYPIVEQGAFGNIEKQWILDKTIACSLTPAGSAFKEDVKPNVAIVQDFVLVGRTKTDIRISSQKSNNSVTNVIISNIKDKNGNPIYIETAGPRSGKSTIFEIGSLEPHVGPFGDADFYKLLLRRSENQAANL